MGWVYLDDRFPEHPKVEAAGGDAAWLFICALAYTNRRNAFDGIIPKSVVARLSDRKNATGLARKLVEVRLWHDRGDHYEIHDWKVWNEQAMKRRVAAKKGAAARWANADAERSDMRSHSEGNAPADADAMHSPKPQTPPITAGVGPTIGDPQPGENGSESRRCSACGDHGYVQAGYETAPCPADCPMTVCAVCLGKPWGDVDETGTAIRCPACSVPAKAQ